MELIKLDVKEELVGPGGGPTLVSAKPDSEVVPEAKRHYLTVAYKLKVMDTIAALREGGQGSVGAYLRREGLYYSSIRAWQKLSDQGLLTAGRKGRRMKKTAMLGFAIPIVFLGCTTLSTIMQSTSGDSEGLTVEEITRGLKEALTIGASNAATSASAPDGFYANPLIFIPFPPEAVKVKNTLEQAGLARLVRDFERSLNNAAEEASKKALPIFKQAITAITFQDAASILKGPENAATIYLKSRTETDLKKEFTPVVKEAIQTVGVTSYWNPIASAYNTITALTGGTPVNPDLEEYITHRALEGMFLLIAEEEKEIRKNPAARVTYILQKVFAN